MVQDILDDWCQKWADGTIPVLYMIDKQDSILVMDTREVATNISHVLKGITAEIYRFASEPIPNERLVAKIMDKTQEQDATVIHEQIEWLIDNKLMIQLSKCVMALAFLGNETDLPSNNDFPGGSIYLEKARSSSGGR